MSAWSFRPGIPIEQQLQELEKTLGIDNLKNVSIDTNGLMTIFTQDKKFQVQLTEV